MRRGLGHVWKRWGRCIKRIGEMCGEDGGDVRRGWERCEERMGRYEERMGTCLEKMGEMY